MFPLDQKARGPVGQTELPSQKMIAVCKQMTLWLAYWKRHFDYCFDVILQVREWQHTHLTWQVGLFCSGGGGGREREPNIKGKTLLLTHQGTSFKGIFKKPFKIFFFMHQNKRLHKTVSHTFTL